MSYQFKTLISVLCFLFFAHSNGQMTISNVTYKKRSTINLDDIKDGVAKQFIQSTDLVMQELEYELIFNNNEAYFSEIQKLSLEDATNIRIARLMGIGDGKFHIDILTRIVLKQKILSSDLFLIESSLDSYEWNRSDETKRIGNYTCFKATTTTSIETVSSGTVEEKITAWYTPEIPVGFGPAGLGGLPGLILEVQQGKFVMYADKITLNATDKKIKIPKKGIKVTEEEYREITKKGAAYYRQYKKN